ncbi:MAG: SGNH/GDSL hydrolase family protein, partial [Bacteroidota bacterium]
CVIVCGLQDILDGQTPTAILDDLGTLISELKDVNENINISYCKLFPTLKEDEYGDKIKYFNELLGDWSSVNGINIIDCDSAFRLGNGEIDDMCYDFDFNNEGVFLNRFGVKRFLSSLVLKCNDFTLCDEWNVIKRTHDASNVRSMFRSKNQRNRDVVPQRQSDNDNVNNDDYVNNVNRKFRRNSNYAHIHENYVNRNFRRYSNYANNPRGSRQRINFARREYELGDPHYSNSTVNSRRGCFNCGEFNHSVQTCRFDHKLRCSQCGILGHKSKLCQNYSN